MRGTMIAASGSLFQPISSQGPNRYGYTQGNPETKTDPTGTSVSCGAYYDDQGCNSYARQFPRLPRNNCWGFAHCVIMIDGPNIPGDPWDCLKCQIPSKGWDAWKALYEAKYGTDNVGFIFLEAPDANNGADHIAETLDNLHDLHYYGFSGTVTLVGHSNGPAAIFHYFAKVASGYYTEGYHVSSFVALDAPLPQLPLVGEWSQWTPNSDVDAAATYVKQNGIQGIYAFDAYDLLSGSVGTGNGCLASLCYWG